LDFAPPAVDRQKKPATAPPVYKLTIQRGPFIEDDYDEDNDPPTAEILVPSIQADAAEAPPDAPLAPAPLQELSQRQVNSPKKPSQPHQEQLELPEKQHVDSAQLTAKPSASALSDTHLNDSIAALLAQKQRAPRAPSNPPPDNLSRRKRGLLGRASSGSSLTSLSRSNSLAPGPTSSVQGEGEKEIVPPQPSQRIIYEDETAWEERAKIIKRMGGQISIEPPVRSVRSIGIVKDLGAEEGVGQRVRRRGR
jgi:DNA replication regulator DPB11